MRAYKHFSTMKSFVAGALFGALSLPLAAHALGNSLETSGGLLTPTYLSIPGSGFQAPQTFTYSLSMKSLADDAHDLVINKITIDLYEKDVSFDDLVMSKSFTASLPVISPSQKSLDLKLKFAVPADLLNDQCASGCSSWFGRLAEDGGLEFYARHTVDYTLVARPPVSNVPEPLAWPLLAFGLPIASALTGRRRRSIQHAAA